MTLIYKHAIAIFQIKTLNQVKAHAVHIQTLGPTTWRVRIRGT